MDSDKRMHEDVSTVAVCKCCAAEPVHLDHNSGLPCLYCSCHACTHDAMRASLIVWTACHHNASAQVSQMRRDAQQYMETLLADLKAQSTSSASSQASNGNGKVSAVVKAKLQYAIKAMQNGLVERDTEVGDLHAAFDWQTRNRDMPTRVQARAYGMYGTQHAYST